ncbi:hypothetical protein ISCGN_010681 [Ixodes scapularis]
MGPCTQLPKPADFTPFPTCGDEVGGAAVSPGVPGVVPGGAAGSPSGIATSGVAVVGGVASVDDYLPYSFHRKAPYLVWDDERSSACRRGLSARSRSRSWGRAPARCCPWRCVLLAALASAVLFGSLVALCAYLSAVRLLGVVKVVEGDVWDPSLLNSTSKEFRDKSAKYANMEEGHGRSTYPVTRIDEEDSSAITVVLEDHSFEKPADFTPFPTCGDEVGGAAVSPGVPGVVPGGAAGSPSGIATSGVAVVGGVASVDDYLPYSFHRKAPYLVWDDERSSACRRGLSARSRSRSWGRAPARCCPWRCVLLAALASAVLFGSLVALCAYLSAITSQHIHPSVRLLGVVKVVEGDVWDPSLLNSTSKEFRDKSAKYANMLQAAYRKSPQLNSSLSKVTIYAFR